MSVKTTVGLLAAVVLLLALMMIPAGAGAQGSTPTPRVPVLFQDDFSTYSGRWTLAESPKAAVRFQDAALALQIASPGVDLWTVPDFTAALADYHLTVEVQAEANSPDALVGFVLDYEDDEDFYVLAASFDGQWLLRQRIGGTWLDLTPETVPDGTLFDQEVLILEAEISGDTVTLWISDVLYGQVTLDEPLGGAPFGLYARAGHGYLNAAFDNLIVTTASGADPA